jgi:hypothetical protein
MRFYINKALSNSHSNSKRMELRRERLLKKILIGIALVALSSGCGYFDTRDYEKAVKANNTQSYRNYLQNRPQGKHAVEAQGHLDSMLFSQAQTDNTEKSYRAYLKERSNGKYAGQALERLTDICYRQAQAIDTINSYRKFLGEFKDSSFAKEADERASYLEDLDRIEQAFHTKNSDDQLQALSDVRKLRSRRDVLRFAPYLIEMLKDQRTIRVFTSWGVRIETVATIASELLQAASGENFGESYASWTRWWSAQKNDGNFSQKNTKPKP